MVLRDDGNGDLPRDMGVVVNDAVVARDGLMGGRDHPAAAPRDSAIWLRETVALVPA